MRKFKILLASVVAVTLFSCEPTFKKEYSWAYPIAGDWMITAYDSVDGAQYSNPFEMRAYNSSIGKDSVWIDDYGTGVAAASQYGNFWTMKFKVAVNMAAKTFSTTTSINRIPGYPINIFVKNGKIIGNDSLYMELDFEDDTTTFILTGHRETGYDEYMGNF